MLLVQAQETVMSTLEARRPIRPWGYTFRSGADTAFAALGWCRSQPGPRGHGRPATPIAAPPEGTFPL
jgi:hypothetical protein